MLRLHDLADDLLALQPPLVALPAQDGLVGEDGVAVPASCVEAHLGAGGIAVSVGLVEARLRTGELRAARPRVGTNAGIVALNMTGKERQFNFYSRVTC